MLIAVDTNILMDLAAEAESRIGLNGARKPVPSARCANKQCLKADQKHRTHYPPERISQAMQFLHLLTAKSPAKNPMQFTGINNAKRAGRIEDYRGSKISRRFVLINSLRLRLISGNMGEVGAR